MLRREKRAQLVKNIIAESERVIEFGEHASIHTSRQSCSKAGKARAGRDRHIPRPPFARFTPPTSLGLEKVPSPRCLMTSIGNERANAISEREPNNETDRESNFEARRHAAVTPPHEIGFRQARQVRRVVAANGTEVIAFDIGPEGSDCTLRLTPTSIHAGVVVRLNSFKLVMP